MEIKDLTTILVVAMVGCVLVAGFIPAVGESVSATDRFTNEGAYYLTDNDDNYTIVYDPSGKFIVNGEDILFSSLPTDRLTVISTEEYLFRVANLGIRDLWLLGGDGTTVKIADSDSEAPVTLIFNNGTVTINEVDYTYNSDSFRGLSKTGDYVRTVNNAPAKINHDTTIIIGDGLTVVASWHDRFYLYGTVEDLTVTPPADITVSDLSVNVTPVAGYVDLVELNSITFVATYDEEHTANAVYTNVIVPKEVTAEKAIHADANTASIVSMIPFILIMGIVLMFVGIVLVRRYV